MCMCLLCMLLSSIRKMVIFSTIVKKSFYLLCFLNALQNLRVNQFAKKMDFSGLNVFFILDIQKKYNLRASILIIHIENLL